MVRYTAEWRAIVLLAARPEIHHSRREKCHQAGCCAVDRWSPTPRVPRWRYQGAPIHRQPASRLRRAAKTPMNCATTWRASHGSIAPLVDVTTDGAAGCRPRIGEPNGSLGKRSRRRRDRRRKRRQDMRAPTPPRDTGSALPTPSAPRARAPRRQIAVPSWACVRRTPSLAARASARASPRR